MPAELKPRRIRIVSAPALALGLLLAGASVALLLQGNPAQAQQGQGPMSAPGCQCSAAVAVPGINSRIAHCICGVMACALNEPIDTTRGSSMLQCVRQ